MAAYMSFEYMLTHYDNCHEDRNKMLRKNSVLIGIVIANILLLVAMFTYPGGSQIDLDSIGYDFINNYFCDLFGIEAQNGMENS